MSWTPCPICGSPLTGYEGSRCTTPEKHPLPKLGDAAKIKLGLRP